LTCSVKCRSEYRRRTTKPSKCVFKCRVCGKLFLPTRYSKGLYCSNACRGMARAMDNPKNQEVFLPWSICEICGSITDGKKTCSIKCETKRVKRVHRDYFRDRHGIIEKQIKCGECGSLFKATPYRKFCSIECCKRFGRRQGKYKRRLRISRKRAERIYRLEIFKRDGWRCQICGRPVKRNAECPHPLSPVLDHIVPLAKGGTHEPKNVQLAHFLCNSLKGDGQAADQLRMF